MLINGDGGARNELGERENEKWEQTRKLEMKLLIGLGFRLGFVPPFLFIFYFFILPFPRACARSPFLQYLNSEGNFAINASNQRIRKCFSDLVYPH